MTPEELKKKNQEALQKMKMMQRPDGSPSQPSATPSSPSERPPGVADKIGAAIGNAMARMGLYPLKKKLKQAGEDNPGGQQ